MPQIDVGVAPVMLPVDIGERPSIENLGPGALYLGTDDQVTTGNGFRVPVDGAYEWPGDVRKQVWAVADAADTDVRILMVG